MISRSSPSISALADFPTPRVSLVSTSKGWPALSRSGEPIVDPGPVAERSPGVIVAHYVRTRLPTGRLIGRPTGLPNGMSIGLDTEISRANRSHRRQRRRARATGIAGAGICGRCDGISRHIGPVRLSQDRPAQTGGELNIRLMLLSFWLRLKKMFQHKEALFFLKLKRA